MNQMTKISAAPDFAAIKLKQNAAWTSGDYGRIGSTLQITGEELAEAADLAPGAKVLDVAAGNGNATLAFARRFCDVTSTDYVEALLQASQVRAEADSLAVNYQVADAEDLPFADGQFDAVVSTFGVMFTPNQKQAAAELQRTCRSGGKIAMANWTPESFIGALFRTLGKHVPPPAGLSSPAQWGTESWVSDTFGEQAKNIAFVRKNFNFRYPSPMNFVNFFRTYYGPVHKAFLAVGDEGATALQNDILDTIALFDLGTDGSMMVPSEYSEIVITKA